MELVIIIGFLLLGLFLLIVEIVFVPGTTVVGIGGVACCAYGIYLSFVNFGSTAGTITIIISAVVYVATLVISFKVNSWERFSLKGVMNSKVNEDFKLDLNIGDTGASVSSLKPMGKANFQDKEVEVTSLGGFIDEKLPIRIIKIENNKVYVEPIS
ncbi:MAG: NfeD family protein [Bacteroidota bacterium]